MIDTETKLKQDDLITVDGWVMLQKIEPGNYRIAKVSERHGNKVYEFAKPKGKRIIVRHYAHNVDPWIKEQSNPDLNKIFKTPT